MFLASLRAGLGQTIHQSVTLQIYLGFINTTGCY